MTRKIIPILLLLLLSTTLFQCANDPLKPTLKMSPNDPFKETIAPSQSFEIDSQQDNVVEGEAGTVIVCPQGCFKNAKGEIVEDKVQIELAEALSLEEMVLSNLTTTSNGKPLETDGMIYFNATVNGEQLTINKDIPIHIEIPTSKKKAGMMAYKGSRDEQGNMDWSDPKALADYLVTVDLDELDFLPPGFQTGVDNGMPFKGRKTATQDLTDSLYYSFAYSNLGERVSGLLPTDYNEPYYNKNQNVVNGKYTDESYSTSEAHGDTSSHSAVSSSVCGIDPAIIKVIKSKKFQNTLIATREFEARLKLIFKVCHNAILELYINNLDKNLYEIDEMAAEALEDTGEDVVSKSQYQQAFLDFAAQRLTKVKEADKYAAQLKRYYEKQLLKVKADLQKEEEKMMQAIQEKNELAKEVVDDYKALLDKRETYRMETYGFEWTETGWINIDNGTLPKWPAQNLEITVTNGKAFDRVYTYVVYTSIKSLYRLNTSDNVQFYVGNDEEKTMLMPYKELAVAIAIGYKATQPSLAIQEFETGSAPKFQMTLEASSLPKVKVAIRTYEKYSKENQITTDLAFMAKFYAEEQRQKALRSETEFLTKLWHIANPCCAFDTIEVGAADSLQ